MSAAVLNWSIFIAQILLGLAMACAAFRLLRGPRAQDRVLGLDTIYVNGTMLMLTFGIRTGSTVYFELSIVSPFFAAASSIFPVQPGTVMPPPATTRSASWAWRTVRLAAALATTSSAGMTRIGRSPWETRLAGKCSTGRAAPR